MRHLRSVLYALVLAPAAWVLCGVGFDHDLTGRALDNGGGPESVGGPLLLLLAGAAYAILLLAPISPAGPLLAGLTFLGVGFWTRSAPDAYAGLWPADIAKDGFNLSTPGYGLVMLLAVPLICTALSSRRWAAYEPPQIVFLGTIGGARGAARPYGPPIASELTTALPPHPGPAADQTVAIPKPVADPTAAIPMPVADGTAAIPMPVIDADRTQALRTQVLNPATSYAPDATQRI